MLQKLQVKEFLEHFLALVYAGKLINVSGSNIEPLSYEIATAFCIYFVISFSLMLRMENNYLGIRAVIFDLIAILFNPQFVTSLTCLTYNGKIIHVERKVNPQLGFQS